MRNAIRSKEGVAIPLFSMPHCPVTVVQRDIGMGYSSIFVPLVFIIPISLPIFGCAECSIKTMLDYRCKKEMCTPVSFFIVCHHC